MPALFRRSIAAPRARPAVARLGLVVMIGTVSVVSMVSTTGCSAPPASQASSSTTGAAAAATDATGGIELPPLPAVQFAYARPEPIVRAAYEFAARHPDVLRHIPCYCGCERNGHGHNEDCFVARRDASGRPEWNPHGIGCGICIDVARQAMTLHRAGQSVVDIRKAIDLKYRDEFPTHTPTAMPHD